MFILIRRKESEMLDSGTGIVLLIGLGLLFLLFFILRDIILWYFKIPEILKSMDSLIENQALTVEGQDTIISLLSEIRDELRRRNSP